MRAPDDLDHRFRSKPITDSGRADQLAVTANQLAVSDQSAVTADQSAVTANQECELGPAY